VAGAGLLGFAAATQRHALRGWVSYTIAAALVLLGTAVAYAGGNGDFSDLMLVASAGVLAGWLIWTGRMGGTGRATPDHAATPVS